MELIPETWWSQALSQIKNVMTTIAEAGRGFFTEGMTMEDFKRKEIAYMKLVRNSHAKLPTHL
jgi:hypothetical protein